MFTVCARHVLPQSLSGGTVLLADRTFNTVCSYMLAFNVVDHVSLAFSFIITVNALKLFLGIVNNHLRLDKIIQLFKGIGGYQF